MRDLPILYSGPMVRALLAGTKTETRRTINFDGADKVVDFVHVGTEPKTDRRVYEMRNSAGAAIARPAGKGIVSYTYKPPFAIGDRLWVREAWRTTCNIDSVAPRHLDAGHLPKVTYEADPENRNPLWAFGRLRAGMHMPRWASRLTLTVLDVRIERLNQITDEAAMDEGVVLKRDHGDWKDWHVIGVDHPNKDFPCLTRTSPREMYAALWDVINGPGAWGANPWVTVTRFDVARGNIDRIAMGKGQQNG